MAAAGIGTTDLDLLHVHDAFPIEELMYHEHVGGPTGLAQIFDVVRELRADGPTQVDGARVGLAHMMGAGSVCVIHVLKQRTG